MGALPIRVATVSGRVQARYSAAKSGGKTSTIVSFSTQTSITWNGPRLQVTQYQPARSAICFTVLASVAEREVRGTEAAPLPGLPDKAAAFLAGRLQWASALAPRSPAASNESQCLHVPRARQSEISPIRFATSVRESTH